MKTIEPVLQKIDQLLGNKKRTEIRLTGVVDLIEVDTKKDTFLYCHQLGILTKDIRTVREMRIANGLKYDFYPNELNPEGYKDFVRINKMIEEANRIRK